MWTVQVHAPLHKYFFPHDLPEVIVYLDSVDGGSSDNCFSKRVSETMGDRRGNGGVSDWSFLETVDVRGVAISISCSVIDRGFS